MRLNRLPGGIIVILLLSSLFVVEVTATDDAPDSLVDASFDIDFVS